MAALLSEHVQKSTELCSVRGNTPAIQHRGQEDMVIHSYVARSGYVAKEWTVRCSAMPQRSKVRLWLSSLRCNAQSQLNVIIKSMATLWRRSVGRSVLGHRVVLQCFGTSSTPLPHICAAQLSVGVVRSVRIITGNDTADVFVVSVAIVTGVVWNGTHHRFFRTKAMQCRFELYVGSR